MKIEFLIWEKNNEDDSGRLVTHTKMFEGDLLRSAVELFKERCCFDGDKIYKATIDEITI